LPKLIVLSDPVYLLHDPGPWHPESPARLTAVQKAIDSIKNIELITTSRPARLDELHLVHTAKYIDYVMSLPDDHPVQLDPDTLMSLYSKEAALKAAGGVIDITEMVMAGKNIRAFCAVRPPGHHAMPDRAMGFCIFNNVAIAAAWALDKKGLERIAIMDWDLHHGNGTEAVFYNSEKALYISTHQSPFYPGTGDSLDTGTGAGTGFNINIPMAAAAGDDQFQEAFEGIILPALNNYKPQLIFISAGFDAHRNDPLGGLKLSTEFFGQMTRWLSEVADKYSDGRIVSVLEGGYNLTAIEETVKIHLEELKN